MTTIHTTTLADLFSLGDPYDDRADGGGELSDARLPTFEQSHSNAYRLLGDAADEIRMGDWTPAPSADYGDEVEREAR